MPARQVAPGQSTVACRVADAYLVGVETHYPLRVFDAGISGAGLVGPSGRLGRTAWSGAERRGRRWQDKLTCSSRFEGVGQERLMGTTI